MNKFLTKIAAAFVGIAMAIGVGVAVGNNSGVRQAKAAESTVSWNASTGALGTAIASQGGTATGHISTGSFEWDYTRTLVNLTSGKNDYVSMSGSYMQLGSSNAGESLELSTSNIPGTIKSVSVLVGSKSTAHTISITVGGTSYLSENCPAWSNSAGATKSGTGSSSGEINITFSINSTKNPLYLASITVVYEENSGVSCTGIAASLTDSTKVWKKGQTVTASDVTVYAEFSDNTDATITNGSGVTITNGTLAAGDNTVTVTYSGQSDTVSVFGKAPTSIATVTSSGTNSISLNASGNSSVSDDLSFEVNYNTTPATADYAATLACTSSGWTKTADDGEGNITLSFESNGTYAFTLTADDDAEVVENLTFTVSGIPTIEYELFSGDIEEGKYLITFNGDALKNTISSDRGDYAAVTVVNDKVSTPAANIIWKIESSDSYWTIYNENVSKYFASTGVNNKAQLLADGEDDKALWTIEESSTGVYHFTNKYNSENSKNAKLQKNGTYGFACYAAYSDIVLYKLPEIKTVTAHRMTAGTVSANSHDNVWIFKGFSFEVQYNNVAEWKDVTANTTFSADKNVPTISANGTLAVAVTPTFKGVEYSGDAANLTATLKFINEIGELYYTEDDESVTVHGVYMGIVGDGYYIMNGEYGIFVYQGNGSAVAPTDAVEKTSKITVSGTLGSFNGLRQIKNATGTVDNSVAVDTPVIYSLTGDEEGTDDLLQNRRTHIEGSLTKIKYNNVEYDSDDTLPTITEGSKDLFLYFGTTNVIFKKGDQTSAAITEIGTALKNGNSITVRAFTGEYNDSFQLRYAGIIEADEDYTAAEFAQELLTATDAVCSGYNGVTNNHDALVSIWNTLMGDDKYLALPGSQKTILVNANANRNSENVVERAMARYDYLVTKYGLSQFITGRTISHQDVRPITPYVADSNTTSIIIVVISMISLTAIGGFFFIKKRKEQ